MELSVDIRKQLPDFELEAAFEAGDTPLGLLGASGSGKSMTLRCIAGLAVPDSGRIVLNGRVLFDSARKINLPSQERNCGFLFQNYALFPHLTLAENITFGISAKSKLEQTELVGNMLEMMNLAGLGERYPRQLSGGQQQRAALARALAVQPEVLLLDEPFSALDNHLRSQTEKQLLEHLRDFSGITVFVSHNLDEVYRICPDLLIADKGKIIARGPKEEIFCRPPNYTSALLTGCKNISKCCFTADQVVHAADWGCSLEATEFRPAPGLLHVGIRAHHLTFVRDPQLSNTFPCRVMRTCEAPHRVTLFLSLTATNSELDSAKDSTRLIQAEISKEKWSELQSWPLPWFVRFNPEKLFLMSEEG